MGVIERVVAVVDADVLQVKFSRVESCAAADKSGRVICGSNHSEII